jgi:hypothetical protein
VVHIFNPTGIALTAFFFFVIKGSILILIIFISTSTQTTTMIVSNPSISNYASLQNLNSNQVKCPCLNVNIPYGNVMSISPILHQICSSDYTSELWITLLSYSYVTFADYTTPSIWGDWHGFEGQHFQLLFSFCQLATKTIDDAIDRFNIQSIITPNVLSESDFYGQLNTSFNQFSQSIIVDFNRLVDTVHLFTQVDQPYFFGFLGDPEMTVTYTTNQSNNQLPFQVFIYLKIKGQKR